MMPLKVGDWMADPVVRMLSKADRADLIDALCQSWMVGAAIAVPEAIGPAYSWIWSQTFARLVEDQESHRIASEAGKKGNAIRWGKDRPPSRDAIRPPTPNPTPLAIAPDPDPDPKKKNMGGKPPDPITAELDRIKAVYPKRHGDQRWQAALGHLRAARKAGEEIETILDGVRRYAAYCEAEDLVGTSFVKQAATFLGTDKCWREPWRTAQRQERGFVG